jgi:hypothetical protein
LFNQKEMTMPRKSTPKPSSKTTAKKHSPVPRKSTAVAAKSSARKKGQAATAAPAVSAQLPVEPAPQTTSTPNPVANETVAPRETIDNGTLTSLLAAAHDSDADTAREAVTSIGLLGDASAVNAVEAILRNVDGYFHPVVRAAASSTLAQLGDTRVVPTLIDTISDPIAEVSAESIRALAALGDFRAVEPLIAVVRNYNGYYRPIARRAAVFALAKLGGELATAELLAVANDESEDAAIRDAARA